MTEPSISPASPERAALRGTHQGFTQVPNAVLQLGQQGALSHGALLTYIFLLRYAWQKDTCFPSQDTLATDLGVSVRSASGYLRELQQQGLIAVQRRGLGKTNVYRLCLPHQQPASDQGRGRDDTSAPDHKPAACPEAQRSSDQDAQQTARKTHRTLTKTQPEPETVTTDPARLAVVATLTEAERTCVDDLAQLWALDPLQGGRLLAQVGEAEVRYQSAALRRLIEHGATIGNPAGWLVMACQNRYRTVAEAPMPTPTVPPVAAPPQPAETTAEPTLWQRVHDEIQSMTTPAAYARWFADSTLHGHSTDVAGCVQLTVGVPSESVRRYLEERSPVVLQSAVAAVLGASVALSYRIDEQMHAAAGVAS